MTTFHCHDCRAPHEAADAWVAPTRCRYCGGTRIEEERKPLLMPRRPQEALVLLEDVCPAA